MARPKPFFPKSHGGLRVDDRRVLIGIIFINRNGVRWSDAPKEYGPTKTLYHRWKRWGDMGVFARMMEGLASEAAVPKTVMMCLWEAVIEEDLFKLDQGAVARRHMVMTLADPLHLGWTLVDKDLMCPFDWEYVPWFLKNCVDDHGTLFPNWMEICRATR